MPENKKTLTKLEIDTGENLYLLTTAYSDGEEGFDLAVSNGIRGWCGSLDENDLETLSQGVKMDYSDYVSQTLKALSRINLGNLNFVYQAKKQRDNSLLLSWKKHVTTENIKFQLGSVKLKVIEDSTDVTLMIFNEAIAASNDLQATINTLRAENERMSTERTNALKRLEKCVAAKEELENDLYSKFAVVINDKKCKIRDLKNEVEDLRSGVPSTSSGTQSFANKHPKRGINTADGTDEDIGVASDYDTDEEPASPAAKKNKQSKEGKVKLESQDDSLLLDTGDDAVAHSTNRRRKREATTKKSTPSRAILPKVSSTPKTATPSTSRGGRRVSMRKSASNGSNVSSGQLDPDAMIDEMFS